MKKDSALPPVSGELKEENSNMAQYERTKGILEVGITENGREVVINHPDLKPDAQGVGHIVFSPDQARNLGRLLILKANEIEGK
jgi:hypothetical protein